MLIFYILCAIHLFILYDDLIINLYHKFKWYFKKLTFDQEALLDPSPGILIFDRNNKLIKNIYIDTKYMFNYLGIQNKRNSYWSWTSEPIIDITFYEYIKNLCIQKHPLLVLSYYADRILSPMRSKLDLSKIDWKLK